MASLSTSTSYSDPYTSEFVNKKFLTGYYIVSKKDNCSFVNLSKSNKGNAPKSGELKILSTLFANKFKKEEDQDYAVSVYVGRQGMKDKKGYLIGNVNTTKSSLVNFFESTLTVNQLPGRLGAAKVKELAKIALHCCRDNHNKDVITVHYTLVRIAKDPNESIPNSVEDFAAMTTKFS